MVPPEFTPLEQQILQASAHPEITERRKRLVATWAVVLITGLVILAFLPVSRTVIVMMFAAYVLITLGEKLAYANAVLAYKSVIRKLRAGTAP